MNRREVPSFIAAQEYQRDSGERSGHPALSRASSNPLVIPGSPLSTLVPGVEHAARLDQKELDLPLRVRLVLDALRDHEHFPRRDMDGAIPKVDPEITLHHDERLVGILVVVPDEVPEELHDLELVVVHLGDDFRLPSFFDQPELLMEVDRPAGHATPPAFEIGLGLFESPRRVSRACGLLPDTRVTMGGGYEGVHVLLGGVEGARDPYDALARRAATGKAVAFGDEPVPDRLRQAHEGEVDLGRAAEPDTGNAGETFAHALRHGIGVARVGEPETIGDVGLELDGDEAHLREQVTAAPAAVAHAL